MLENWIFLSLLAPLFWAFSNFIDKYLLGKHTKGIYDFLFFSSVTSWSWIFIIVLVFFVGFPELNNFSWIPIVTGVSLLYSYGFYGKALEKGDTSALVILFKLIPVVTVVLAFIFLGQKLSANEWPGFLIVLMGAILVSFEKIGRKGFIKGFWLILIAILMWAIVTVTVDYGLQKIAFWDYFILDIFGQGVGGLSLLLLSPMRREIVAGVKTGTVKKYSIFMGNNLLDLFGQVSIKKALAIGPSAGLITVVTQVQSFYAIVIGLALSIFLPHIIKEDISSRTLVKKFIGAAIMFTGIYILLT